nr:CDP-diacylglycerol--glycerol-3-phosphate 3-phosphatidyltransferase [Clostridia bacterium]
MNLPNKLTIFRVILIPFFMVFIIFPILPEVWSRIIAAAIFIIASFTDMLDGMIARRYNLVTDLGKFLDPLADKLLVFGGMLSILVHNSDDKIFTSIFVWVVFIFLTRELAVTSLRLMAVNKSGKVIAAGMLGKIKTVSQMLTMVALLLEPVIVPASSPIGGTNIISYVLMAIMTVMTVWSGVDYFIAFFKAE